MSMGTAIQVDNGNYTRIHNTILETLSTAMLAPLEFRIVLFLLRKTYGFQKKDDVISISQFMTCGGSRTQTIAAIKNLLRLQVIYRQPQGQAYRYGFNKYVDQWHPAVFASRRAGAGLRFGAAASHPTDTSQQPASNPGDTSTGNPTGTSTSNPTGTHKRKKEKKEKNPHEQQLMFGALAQLCQVDPRLKRGQLAKTAKTLLVAGYSPADLEGFAAWWARVDFRGRRGDPPTLSQVAENILRAKQEWQPKAPPDPAAAPAVVFHTARGREVWQGGELIRIEPK